MSGLSTGARVAHVLVLGLWLGAGLLINLVLAPDAIAQLQSRQLATELIAEVIRHLDYFFLASSPIILLSLVFGYFSLATPLKARVISTLVMTGLVVLRSQWLHPKMIKIHQAMGRSIDDVVASDPMKIQYLNLETATQWLFWLQLGLALYLIVVGVATSTPKRKFGIEF